MFQLSTADHRSVRQTPVNHERMADLQNGENKQTCKLLLSIPKYRGCIDNSGLWIYCCHKCSLQMHFFRLKMYFIKTHLENSISIDQIIII